MKSSHLQSLSKRVKNCLAAIHVEIRFEAQSLTGNDEFDKRTYSTLSRLQRERKKLEALAVSLKRELKTQVIDESMCRLLAKAGFSGLVVSTMGLVDVINQRGEVYERKVRFE